MAFGGRLTVAAYAASFSLRSASAFSVHSSSVLPLTSAGAAHQSFPYKNFVMSSSASSDADIDVDIAGNIAGVKQRMDDAISANDRPAGSARLVAVSKTKPLELLQAAYEVRYFSMNNIIRHYSNTHGYDNLSTHANVIY